MPRLGPRFGPLGIALTLYDVYRRLPAEQRRLVLDAARKHGPGIASKAIKAYAGARDRRLR